MNKESTIEKATKNDQIPLVEDRNTKEPTKVAGYEVKDIAKAPLEPPSPGETESKETVRNKKILFLVVGGAALGVIGLFLLVLQFMLLGALLATIAAVVVLSAVFLPIK